jgi:hypothetical protein
MDAWHIRGSRLDAEKAAGQSYPDSEINEETRSLLAKRRL